MSAREIFASVLRGYREQSGLTQDQAAKKLTLSLSLYKKIEGCERRPQSDFAKRCDDLYGTPAVFTLLHEAVLAEPYPEWFGPRILHEDRATVIHEWEMRGIPGLLQTEDYARAVFQAGRPYDAPAVIDRDVRARLERQDILSRDNPPRLWVVIAEGVLRQATGGPDVMRGQLDHLLAVSDSQHAVLQILPFSADSPGANGPAVVFEFEDSRPVAYLEGWNAGRVVEDPKEVADITTALSMIKSCALSPSESKRLMSEIRG